MEEKQKQKNGTEQFFEDLGGRRSLTGAVVERGDS